MAATNVMIVEDEALVAVEIRQKLKQIGYEVTSIVTSGESAVQKVAEDRPDVVLMDIRLPGALDGIEAAEQIRSQYNIPVIYLTAHADIDSIARAKLTEPFGYLVKPVQPKELQITLDIALYKHTLQTELQETNQRLEQEIVERKRAEEALREREDLMRRVIDATPVCIFVKDRDGKYLLVNKQMADIHGIMPETMVGKTDLDYTEISLAGDEEVEQFLADDREVIDSKQLKFIPDETFTLPDGTRRSFQATKIPLTLKDKLDCVLGVAVDITERKQLEESLRESKQLLERTFASLRDAVLITDAETAQIIGCNPIASEIFGYSREEMLGQTTTFLHVDEATREAFRSHLYLAVQKKGFLEHLEFSMKRKDGTIFPTEHCVMPLEDEQGKRIGWVSVVRDITAHKRTEEALSQERNLMQTLMDTLPDTIYFKDRDSRFIRINQAKAKRHNLQDPAEAVGKTDFDFFAAEQAKLTYLDEQRIIQSGQPLIGKEEQLIWPDGHTIWVSTTKMPIRNQEGHIIGTFGVSRDITERKQAEERRYLLERVIETVPLGVTISDKKGKILYTNLAEAQMHGCTTEELIGQNANMLAPKDLWKQMDEEQPEHVKYWKRESLNIRKDGSVFPVQLISTAVKDTNGAFLGLVTTCEDITTRKQTEEALQESEERFRSFMKYLPGVAFIKDTEGQVLFANEFHKKLFSLESEDLVGRKTDTLWNADIAERFAEQDRTVLSEGRALEIEESYPDLEGLRHWLTCKFPIFRQGEPKFIGGISLDITARKQAEEELRKYQEHLEELVEERTLALRQQIAERERVEESLRESEERFRTISDLISDYAYVARVEPDGGLVREWVTEAFTRITGYTPEELDEHGGWKSIVHPEDRDIALQHRQEFLSGNESIIEYRIITKHDDVLWLWDYVRPVRDASTGRVMRIFGAVQDITQRKRMEEALAEERNLLRTVIDNIPDHIFVKDVESRFLLANKTVIHATGVTTLDELMGKTDFDFFPPELAEQYYTDERAVIESGQLLINREEPVIYRETDTSAWLLTTKVPFRDTQGKIVGFVGISRNITQRKQMEEELREAKEAAEAANRLKSEFLANMSHDIRTPMNAILGFSEILKEQLRDFPQYQEYLHRITNSGHLLLQLINDILDLSKIEAGRLEIKPEAVNLPAVLTEIRQMFSAKAREKRIRFKTFTSLDVPTTILLDGTRLRQILVNVVGNAIKFTGQGRVTLEVTKVTNETNETKVEEFPSWEGLGVGSQSSIVNLQFSIEDTGIGIPQEDQGRIFDPFQQHTRSFGGTGLGLAITKRLVEMMNGTISVKSTVNQGSVFTVRFPEVSIVPSEQEILTADAREALNVHFHGATLLLVEDNAANRDLIHAYLASYNLRIVDAENGQEALEILNPGNAAIDSPLEGGRGVPSSLEGGRGVSCLSQEGQGVALRPALIFMDIHMPVMGGKEATQHLKADPDLQRIPVVALTAYAIKEQQDRYQDLFDAYLSKPIAKDALIATLAQFLPHTKTSLEGKHPPTPLKGEAPPPTPLKGEAPPLPPSRGESMPVLPRERIVEDLKDYAAEAGSFPQALRDTLHDKLLLRHQEICEVMMADEMIEFAEAVIIAGDTFTIPPLKHYGEELLRYIKVFDIMTIKRLLALFPEIVEIICGHEE